MKRRSAAVVGRSFAPMALAALTPVSFVACHEDKSASSAENAPSPSASEVALPTASPLRWTSDAEPVVATFVDLAKPVEVALGLCEVVVIDVVDGRATAEGEALAPGDILFVQGEGKLTVTGAGSSVIAAVRERPCDNDPARKKRVVRASAAPELAFAGGAMRVHLDAEPRDGAPSYAYVGRLEGTAPVAEHLHPGSWEVVCASVASGTFTLAGVAKRLGPRTCVAVAPDTKHSWQPDPGSSLVAVQIYDPPGPEQRFKKLAALPSAASTASASPPLPATDGGR